MLCPASQIQAHADGSNDAIERPGIVRRYSSCSSSGSLELPRGRSHSNVSRKRIRAIWQSRSFAMRVDASFARKDAALRRCFAFISAQSLIQHSVMSVARNGMSFQTVPSRVLAISMPPPGAGLIRGPRPRVRRMSRTHLSCSKLSWETCLAHW